MRKLLVDLCMAKWEKKILEITIPFHYFYLIFDNAGAFYALPFNCVMPLLYSSEIMVCLVQSTAE